MINKGCNKLDKDIFTSNHCLQCSKIREPCCSNPQAPLTIKDIEYIVSKGFEIKDFVELVEYTIDEFENGEDWWKESMIKIEDKFYRPCIKVNSKGCVFLKDGEGCILGKNRPLFCKIYPFWIDENNKLIYLDSDDSCLIVVKNIELKKALEYIHESDESIRKYFEEIKYDCINRINDERKIVEKIINQ